MAQPEWMKRDLETLSVTTVGLSASTVVPASSSEQGVATRVSVAAERQVAVDHEPAPTLRPSLPDVWELVMRDMEKRADAGYQRYGTRLRPFNGRCPLVDAYQEALDLCVYLRQRIWEDENESSRP